jgi:hypothetical protein
MTYAIGRAWFNSMRCLLIHGLAAPSAQLWHDILEWDRAWGWPEGRLFSDANARRLAGLLLWDGLESTSPNPYCRLEALRLLDRLLEVYEALEYAPTLPQTDAKTQPILSIPEAPK